MLCCWLVLVVFCLSVLFVWIMLGLFIVVGLLVVCCCSVGYCGGCFVDFRCFVRCGFYFVVLFCFLLGLVELLPGFCCMTFFGFLFDSVCFLYCFDVLLQFDDGMCLFNALCLCLNGFIFVAWLVDLFAC